MNKNFTQNLPNGVIICFDKSLRYTIVEGKDLAELGYDPSQMLGKTIEEVIPEHMVARVKQKLKTALQGEVSTYEMVASNGTNYFCTLYPLFNEKNEVIGGMLMGVNIKNVKKTESGLEAKIDELKELNKKLKKEVSIRKAIEKNLKDYSEELKIKNSELEQFAYVASHDLQEPLRMIASFTQLLGNRYKGKLDDDADEFLNFILEGASRMQRLINDLLIYSRVGRKGSEMKHVSFNKILDAAKENIGLALDETDAIITHNDLPVVYGDQGQLVQLLQNLLSNAIKFRKPEETPKIEIKAAENETEWEICVIDNGIGVDMRHKDRIFNIFQRLHNQDKFPGTGIGLAICKKIVERHGGEIWVDSNAGKGSTFCFTLKKQVKHF